MEGRIRRAEERDIDVLAEMYVELHNFHTAAFPSRLLPVARVDDRLLQARLCDREAQDGHHALTAPPLGTVSVG